MLNFIGEDRFSEIFDTIFQSKAGKDLIENKLDILHRIQVYEMRYFFKSISHEEYLNYQSIPYKNKDGIEYLENSLQLLNNTALSSASKDKVIGMVEDIYNCYNLVFPRERFSLAREVAVNRAQNDFYDKQDREADKLIEALGLSINDKNYNDNKATILKLIKNKDEIEKISRDAEYITQRLDDVKDNLNSSENEFNRDKEKLIGQLRKENETYKTTLQKSIDVDLDALRIDIKQQRDAIKNTMGQFNILNERLSVIDQNVYREELAIFFLKEHDEIKGKIDPIYLFISILSAVSFTEFIISYLKSHEIKPTILNEIELFFLVFLIVTKIGDWIAQNYWTISDDYSFNNLRNFLTPYWCWLLATLVGMGTILYKAIDLSDTIKKNIENGIDPLHSVLPYCGIYLVLAWFTWFASKQFSYNKQICDEYEYKYALSKSYMLYKKEAESVITEDYSNAVLLALLDSVIKNIAHSPVQSVKQDVHTPFSEAFKVFKDSVNKKNIDD